MPRSIHPAVRGYLAGLTAPEDQLLEDVRLRSKESGVTPLSPDTAALLAALAFSVSPRRILEIGTGYGYSSIHLAQALVPDGLLFTVERDPERAAVAREHFGRAGLAGRVNVMVGEAARLVHKVAGPFDVIVQDGSKDQYEPLLDRLVALLRPRGLLVSDNVLWRDGESYSRCLTADPRLITVFLPIGDGVAVSVKRDAAEATS
jgi:predicted O-methyltransferase YrrM